MNEGCRMCLKFLSAATAILPCFAFIDYRIVGTEIPDAYAVNRWCEELRAVQRQFVSPEGRRIVAAGLQDCQAFRRRQIDGQRWSTNITRLGHEAAKRGLLNKELENFPYVRPLPTDYPCYAMMLFPDYAWKDRGELADIRKAFSSFGDAIGEKGAAVWFLDERGKIDVQRALFYCDRFALSSSDGPYILVSPHRPDMIRNKEDAIVIKCAGISAARLRNVLGVLEADLRAGREIRKRQLLFSEVKQWLLSESERQNLSALGITIAVLKTLGK